MVEGLLSLIGDPFLEPGICLSRTAHASISFMPLYGGGLQLLHLSFLSPLRLSGKG